MKHKKTNQNVKHRKTSHHRRKQNENRRHPESTLHLNRRIGADGAFRTGFLIPEETSNSAQEPIGPGASATKPKVASGTHGNASGLNEYELTLQVSLQLRDELEARGYEVYMIRTTHDVNISNAERAQMAAAAGADILVRIHANGSDKTSISGALTMAPSNSNPYLTKSVISASQTLSRKIVDNFCAATGAKNQGVMSTDAMSGINWSTIPVSIVEMGYMTNRAEDLKMASASYQAKMVQGIANGIDAYYGATA